MPFAEWINITAFNVTGFNIKAAAFKCLELKYLVLKYLKKPNMNVKAFEIKISYQWSIITIQALVDVDQSKRQA